MAFKSKTLKKTIIRIVLHTCDPLQSRKVGLGWWVSLKAGIKAKGEILLQSIKHIPCTSLGLPSCSDREGTRHQENAGLAFLRHIRPGSNPLHMQLPLALSDGGPSGMLSLWQTNRGCCCPLSQFRSFVGHTSSCLSPPDLPAHSPSHSLSYLADSVRLFYFIISTFFYLLYSVCFCLLHSRIFCLLPQSREKRIGGKQSTDSMQC